MKLQFEPVVPVVEKLVPNQRTKTKESGMYVALAINSRGDFTTFFGNREPSRQYGNAKDARELAEFFTQLADALEAIR